MVDYSIQNNINVLKNKMIIEWNEIIERYEIICHLGVGSYGNVVEAIDRNTGNRVAIKQVNNIFNDIIDSKRILREITLLRNMNSQFVVKIINIIAPSTQNFNKIFIVFEYSQADLKKLIKSSTQLREEQVRIILYQILCGIKYIHSCLVLHRDLKPANILINEDLSIKICDFGLARSVQGIIGCGFTEEENLNNDLISPNTSNLKHSKKSLLIEKKKTFNNIFTELRNEPKQKSFSSTNTSNTRKIVKLGDIGKSKKLTCHVVTRWYRAPELILLEKDYTNAIDIWSIGCIFAELMMMLTSNAKTCFERSALFPGKSCFPLSPDRSSTDKTINKFPSNNTDQLNLIFNVLGTPSDDDLDFITDEMALDYLKSFEKRSPKNLYDTYAGSCKDSIDLLYKMIKFNPNKRITVDQALEHTFFSQIRIKELELEEKNSPNFDFEKDENLDFEKIRKLFINEINYYSNNN